MRKLTLLLAMLCLPLYLLAQVVTTTPTFIEQGYTGTITITFDPNQGSKGMVGATACYAHMGLITADSKDNKDWKYVITAWCGKEDFAACTKVGDKWQLVINDLYATYKCPTTEDVKGIVLVFNDGVSGGKEGKNADGTDIFIPVNKKGLNVRFDLPEGNQLLNMGEKVECSISSSEAVELTLLANGAVLNSAANASSLQHTFTPSAVGDYTLVAQAKSASQTVYDTVQVCVISAPVSQVRPSGMIDGINYHNDDPTKVTLVMYAKNTKGVVADNVFVIGDFNNWTFSNDFQMKRDAQNSGYFWLEISNLEPKKEYAFQYAVKTADGVIKITDAYTEKVLDPWNDQYISQDIYPNLKSYPRQTDGLTAVFQTGKEPFKWSDATLNFKNPDRNNLVIYELWVHDFSPARSIKGVINRLDYLQNLGVNVIELMPICEFDGNISWGYNPHHYFAPDKAYGTPEDYKTLVDEAHKRGMAVILDMVFNQADGKHPFVQLYRTDDYNGKDNPWINSKPANFPEYRPDFNHDSPATQEYFKRVLKYWIQEYKVDGYRMDLTKGFCGPTCISANRVKVINDYYNAAKSMRSDALFILEHWEGSEEGGFVNNGMLCWGGGEYYNNAFSQLAMGWLHEGDGSIVDGNKQGWVYFAESHDEERNMFKAKQWGNGNLQANAFAYIKRVPLIGAFALLQKGPKMMWQFQELGFDFSIKSGADGVYKENENHRVDPKPQPETLGWLKDADRMDAYKRMAQLIQLRTKLYPAEFFLNGKCTLNAGTGKSARSIVWEYNGEYIVIVGNFNVEGGTQYTGAATIAPFPKAGKWYDYYRQTSYNVNSTADAITLQPGELRIYTSTAKQLPTIEGDYTYPDNIIMPEFEGSVYPTMVDDYLFINSTATLQQAIIYNLQGKQVGSYQGDIKQINMTGFNSGIYLLQLTTDDTAKTFKLIKR